MKATDELIVINKTYDFVLWCAQHAGRFPRNHRYTLGTRIEQQLYDVLELLLQAKYRSDRQGLLQAANLKLEVLRFQLRLAHDLQCWKTNSFGFACQSLDEIGRMIGGWLKATEKTASAKPAGLAERSSPGGPTRPAKP